MKLLNREAIKNLIEFDMDIGNDRLGVWYYLHMSEMMDQWDTIRHSNTDYEIHVIVKGSCVFETEKERHFLKKGDVLLICPGNYHASGQTSEDFLRFTVNFNLDRSPELDGTTFEKASAETLLLCEVFQKEAEKQEVFKKEMMISLLKAVIVSAWRDIFGSRQGSRGSEVTLDFENRISVIDRYFQANYSKECGEEELAGIPHLSRRQLVRILKESYGKGFRERLLETRMEQASWLLKTTNEKMGEIAGEVGYSSEASFYRVFKGYFGLTPAEYREKARN